MICSVNYDIRYADGQGQCGSVADISHRLQSISYCFDTHHCRLRRQLEVSVTGPLCNLISLSV